MGRAERERERERDSPEIYKNKIRTRIPGGRQHSEAPTIQRGYMAGLDDLNPRSRMPCVFRLASLPAHGPPLERQHQDYPGHGETNKAHGHGVEEHGIQVVEGHRGYRVGALESRQPADLPGRWYRSRLLTLAQNMTPPDMRPKAAISSVGGRDGITERGGRRYISR